MGDATAASATATATAASSSYFSFQVGHFKPGQMPFSSYYSTAQPSAHYEMGDEPGAAAAALSADAYDCESEEGVEVLEERVKPASSRSSGSKRSRAAEVHNLSEKRRRSRINEKMKALQNLIPNSNKTDKASMLDEAIEYLKQLQIQVQMLSMRNGLNLHPMYFPGAMQPLQASQVPVGFGINNESLMNMGVGMLTLNQESSASSSFDPLNRCTSSHQSAVLPSLTNITHPESSFRIESSQSRSGSFQLTLPAEDLFTEELATQGQFDTGRSTRRLQESFLDADRMEACMLGKQRSQDILSKDPDHQILIQHLHGLQGGSFPSSDVKAEATYF